MRNPQDRKTELGVNVPTTSWRGLRVRDLPEHDFFWLGGGAGRTTIRYFGSASTTASVNFPSVGRGKYWFGDTLLPYPRRNPSSFTFGFGRRNFKRTESLVVLMCTFRLGFLPFGNFCAFPRASAILPQRSRHPRLESMLHLFPGWCGGILSHSLPLPGLLLYLGDLSGLAGVPQECGTS